MDLPVESPFRNPPPMEPLSPPPPHRNGPHNVVTISDPGSSLRSSSELAFSLVKFPQCEVADPFPTVKFKLMPGAGIALLPVDGMEQPGCMKFGNWCKVVEKATKGVVKKSKSGLGKARNILSTLFHYRRRRWN